MCEQSTWRELSWLMVIKRTTDMYYEVGVMDTRAVASVVYASLNGQYAIHFYFYMEISGSMVNPLCPSPRWLDPLSRHAGRPASPLDGTNSAPARFSVFQGTEMPPKHKQTEQRWREGWAHSYQWRHTTHLQKEQAKHVRFKLSIDIIKPLKIICVERTNLLQKAVICKIKKYTIFNKLVVSPDCSISV